MNNERASDFGYLSPLSFKRREGTLKDRPAKLIRSTLKCTVESPQHKPEDEKQTQAKTSHRHADRNNISTSKHYAQHSRNSSNLKERPLQSRPNTRSYSNLSGTNKKL